MAACVLQNGKLTGSCGDAKLGLANERTQTVHCTSSGSMTEGANTKYPIGDQVRLFSSLLLTAQPPCEKLRCKVWYPIGDQVYIEAKSTLTLCEVKVYGRKPFKKKAKSCGTPKVTGTDLC